MSYMSVCICMCVHACTYHIPHLYSLEVNSGLMWDFWLRIINMTWLLTRSLIHKDKKHDRVEIIFFNCSVPGCSDFRASRFLVALPELNEALVSPKIFPVRELWMPKDAIQCLECLTVLQYFLIYLTSCQIIFI